MCMVERGEPGSGSDGPAQGHGSVTSGSLYLPLELLVRTDPCLWEAPKLEASVHLSVEWEYPALTRRFCGRSGPGGPDGAGRCPTASGLSAHPRCGSLAAGLSLAAFWGPISETACGRKRVCSPWASGRATRSVVAGRVSTCVYGSLFWKQVGSAGSEPLRREQVG